MHPFFRHYLMLIHHHHHQLLQHHVVQFPKKKKIKFGSQEKKNPSNRGHSLIRRNYEETRFQQIAKTKKNKTKQKADDLLNRCGDHVDTRACGSWAETWRCAEFILASWRCRSRRFTKDWLRDDGESNCSLKKGGKERQYVHAGTEKE